MALGKNINLFLMDGKVAGRVKCTLANWTGVAYKIPRTMIKEARSIGYLNQTGVYFLLGSSEESDKPVAYIGQAGIRKNGEGILCRLEEHLRDEKKDYWNEVVAFTTSNNSFGPTEISYLENRFYNIAKKHKRCELKNSNDPNPGNITEEKESELEEFILYARLIMGVLGYNILESLRNEEPEEKAVPEIPTLYLNRNGLDAQGQMTADGFVVLKGSRIALKETRSCPDPVRRQREAHLMNKEEVDEQGFLKEDLLFKSPSGAAGFVTGGSANGWIEWKDKTGKTLRALESEI